MKNQNDLIIVVVSLVLSLIIAGVLFGTKPVRETPPSIPKVVTTPPQLSTANVKMAAALPNAPTNSGGGAARPGGAGRTGGGTPGAGGMTVSLEGSSKAN